MILRHAIATVAALTVTAALAPSAHAWTNRFTFSSVRGAPALITVDTPYANTRLELVRDGTIIGHGFTDELEVSGLMLNDVANLYVGNGDTLVARAAYDATPSISETACIGQAGFNVKKSAGAHVLDAGAYEPFAGDYRALPSSWTVGDSFTVKLPRPLLAGDIAYAETFTLVGDTEIHSFRGVPVLECACMPQAGDPDAGGTPAAGTARTVAHAADAGTDGADGQGVDRRHRFQPAPAAAPAPGEAPEPPAAVRVP